MIFEGYYNMKKGLRRMSDKLEKMRNERRKEKNAMNAMIPWRHDE